MVGNLSTLIRLRRAIQRHTLSWKRVLGLVLGILGAVLTWAGTLFAADVAQADVLRLLLAFWLVGWVLGPILSSGAAVLRPEYFTLLPLPRRSLGFGLLASVFVGVGAAVTAGAVLALVAYAAPGGFGAVAVGVVGAALLLVLIVALSRALYQLLGAAMRTWLGVEIAAMQYGLIISAMFAGWLAIQPVVSALPVLLTSGLAPVPGASAVVSWLPSGWPVQAVDAAVGGRWGEAFGMLGLLALAAVAVVAAAVALLTPHVGARTARRSRPPRGSRVLTRPAILPATPFGAVLGKELRSWWRDPWRSLEIRSAVWTALFLALYLALAGWAPAAAFGGAAVTLMIALSGANLYGYDGTALWQLVVAQGRDAIRADVRGRQVGMVVAFALPALEVSALLIALTGAWGVVVPVLALLVALTGVGVGTAILMSVVGVTAGVDPHRRVNSADAGANGVVIQVAMWATITLTAPTVVAAILLATGVLPVWSGVGVLLLAGLNGVLPAWYFGRIAEQRLEARMPEMFARVRYPGMPVSGEGGGWLDRFTATAEKNAIKERAAAGAQAGG